MAFTDTQTGQEIDGMAIILRTTDGEVLVDPARLFGNGVVASDQKAITDLQNRVAELEAAAKTAPVNPAEQTPAPGA